MEIVGGILVALVLLTILAAIGVTTVVAFGLMALLGLVTEMSFKRVFFVSFMMALAAPLLLGIAGYAAIEDGSLERDLRDGLGETIVIPTGDSAEWRETIPRIRELRDELRDGRISPDEFERELEQLVDEATSVRIDVEGIDASDVEDAITIEVN
ncbi:MAG: hypothetical protein ACX930_02710 [Erythrobacter sp.]